MERICTKCKRSLPYEMYSKNAARSLGLSPRCKDCQRIERLKSADWHKEYLRKRYAEDPEFRSRRALQAHKADTPEKIIARRRVNDRIATGTLVRGSCKICGKPKADAHHEDYSKPLEIIWLCRSHHKQYHAGRIKI